MEMLYVHTAVTLSVYFTLFGVGFSTASAGSADIAVKRLSACSVEVEGEIVDLSSLQRRDGYPRFTVVYGSWNYSFNPCDAYNEPRDPHRVSNTFGDKCLHVSLCKFKTVGKRKFYYSIGTQSSATFSALKYAAKNVTEVELSFTGTRSMVHKKVHMRLVCDKTRIKPEDADFSITADKIRGNIYAELAHVCACPGICAGIAPTPTNGNSTGAAGSRVAGGDASKEPSDSVNSKARSLLIVFGINIGLLILAVFIGGLCYSKRSALRSYNKLPGLHPHWSGSGKHSKIEKFPTIGLESSRKAYRDYEASESKTQLPPVLEDCEIPVGHLEVKQRLGGNIFGDTYRGSWKDTLVAIKCITHGIQLSENHSEVVRKIKAEVSLLSKQRHKNIAAMIGMCLEAKFPYIVNQLVNGRSVRDYLRAEGYVSWSQKVRMCTQAADGMTFLHSVKPNPITHRDIRCANLMITPEEVVIVVDFGVTAILEPVRQECSRPKCFCQKELSACPASIRWTAQEILSHSGGPNHYTLFTPSSDVYSFGMMMWEMISVVNPFPDIQAEVEVMEIVKAGGRPVIPSDETIPPRYKDLIRECWDTEPLKRPTFKQVVSALKEAMTQARSKEKRNHAQNMSSTSSLQASVI